MATIETRAKTIVGLGEVLFDCFPNGEALGGAPINLAIHAHQIFSQLGGRGVVASRVGEDARGDRIRDTLRGRGLETTYLQRDSSRRTGVVEVTLDDDGQPDYTIRTNVAWDALHFNDQLAELARRCSAVCFGSLAQREATTRDTIQVFLNAARGAIRLFDVNLRQKFFTRSILERSFNAASCAKMNEHELPLVCSLLEVAPNRADRPDIQAFTLIQEYKLDLLALTRGGRGTVLYSPARRVEGRPIRFDRDPDADSVGAGDACGAGLITGLLLDWPLAETVDLANRLGAFVASRPGATPVLPAGIVAAVADSARNSSPFRPGQDAGTFAAAI